MCTLRPTTLTFLFAPELSKQPVSPDLNSSSYLERGKRQVLLAKKLRGFGVGKWNGPGGKMEAQDQGDIFATAIRETMEEIGVTPVNLSLRGTLSFYFDEHESWNTEVHVFTSNHWIGTPSASEEMEPQWFHENEIPYEEMWEDDIIWFECPSRVSNSYFPGFLVCLRRRATPAFY